MTYGDPRQDGVHPNEAWHLAAARAMWALIPEEDRIRAARQMFIEDKIDVEQFEMLISEAQMFIEDKIDVEQFEMLILEAVQ